MIPQTNCHFGPLDASAVVEGIAPIARCSRGTDVKNIYGVLLVGCSAIALAGCGASDISSPGSGGDVIINPPATPAPDPTPTVPGVVTPAAGCPTIADPQGLADGGTLKVPTGEWRVCRLPSLIRTSITLPKVAGVLYEMSGRVNVGCDGGFTAPTGTAPYTSTTTGCTTPLSADTNVTLSISPGVIVYAATGQSWLAVNRGNKISAVGSATQPIIFTSLDNVHGRADDTSQGHWGGVVLMGRGLTTDCAVGSVASSTCERNTEGSADLARYGGTDNAYNAGRMSFVQIRYSGFTLGANSELQALTLESVGTGTVLDHIQAHNSSDDGAEFFGGAVNMTYYAATGADDDSLDVDTGAQANLQYVVLAQRPGRGDALMEIDSNGFEADTPRTKLTVSNFVALQPQVSSDNEANAQASLFFRGNSDITLANGIIATPNNECIRMNGSGATPATLATRSVVMQCNATRFIGTNLLNASQVAAAFGSGANNSNDTFTPTLASLFINGANEDAVPAFDASVLSTFFKAPSPNRIGVAWTGNDSGFAGWTCNSATMNFGSASSACTTLPVT